jgi:hypothetical protein
MLPDSFSLGFLQIVYRPDLGQLTGRWLRSIDETELHEGYAALRRAALHHRCAYWLIDGRRRTNRSYNGPEWVTTRFLPELQREMGQPLCVCFLVLPDYLSALPPDSSATAPGPLRYARFVDEGAANAWLAAQQMALT